jgi:serine/threonine protein kinase
LPHAKFSKKADVFAAGIIFLELISLSPPNILYQVLWPRIIHEIPLPQELKEILSKSLAEAPETRTGSFDELLLRLRRSKEKVVLELINDEGFSIDVSFREGHYVASVLAGESEKMICLQDWIGSREWTGNSSGMEII